MRARARAWRPAASRFLRDCSARTKASASSTWPRASTTPSSSPTPARRSNLSASLNMRHFADAMRPLSMAHSSCFVPLVIVFLLRIISACACARVLIAGRLIAFGSNLVDVPQTLPATTNAAGSAASDTRSAANPSNSRFMLEWTEHVVPADRAHAQGKPGSVSLVFRELRNARVLLQPNDQSSNNAPAAGVPCRVGAIGVGLSHALAVLVPHRGLRELKG